MKALFFDIDGTLLSHRHHCIPKRTIEALDKCRQNGHLVFIATGRSLVEIEHLPVKDLAFDGYVLLNGQMCLNQDKEIIYAKAIDDEDLIALKALYLEKKYPLMMVTKNEMYINFINEDVRQAHGDIATALPPIEDTPKDEPIYLAVAYVKENEVDEVMEPLNHCRYTRWSSFGVDIVEKGMSKVIGIQEIMQRFNLSKEDIICFGDGDNDIEMLQFASIGVAMGNGSEQVKASADYITDDVDEDGIYNALQKLKLL